MAQFNYVQSGQLIEVQRRRKKENKKTDIAVHAEYVGLPIWSFSFCKTSTTYQGLD